MPPNGPQQQVPMTSLQVDQTDYDWLQELEENGSLRTIGGDSALRGNLSRQYEVAQSALRYFSLDWDEFEDLLFVQGRTPDNTRVRVSEGSLSTIVIERAGRVMSNLPTGTVHALGLQNEGKGLLMNLTLEKYIYPNANEQYDLETKLFMWDMYSNVYGTMAMAYDWTSNMNYNGPDCWLVPMRNFFPQQGRLSIQNCDFVFISNFISRETLQEILEEGDDEYYDLSAIEILLSKTAQGGLLPKARQDYLRTNPMWEWRRRAPLTDTGQIEIVTKYEAGPNGRWIDFAPDFDNIIIRNIKNPHKDGRIPVVLKYGLPTLDSIIGRGDMEAGRFQQYAMDTTLNLQIDRLRLATYPPIKVVNGNVVMPTIRFQPGAKWLVSNPNDVSHHQFPDVQENMNLTYQFLKGALNNTLGNTTTQVSAENTDSSQGKTPQAIKSMNQSQSTRDSIDAKLMSKAIEQLFGGFLGLINNVEQKNPIEFYQFGDEIAQIAQNYPDIKDAIQFEGKKSGADVAQAKVVKIVLKPSKIKNEKGYVYKIDPMSTQLQDKQAEHQQLLEIYTEYLPNAQVVDGMLAKTNMMFDFGDFFKRLIQTGGLRDVNSIIKPVMTAQPNQGAQPTQPGQGGPQWKDQLNEAINIKDLPPVGQVQLASQAGIQTTPQDWTGQLQTQAEIDTQSKIAVKNATTPTAGPTQAAAPAPGDIQAQPVSQVQPPTPGTIPELAQARAEIAARHAGVHQRLTDDIAKGKI